MNSPPPAATPCSPARSHTTGPTASAPRASSLPSITSRPSAHAPSPSPPCTSSSLTSTSSSPPAAVRNSPQPTSAASPPSSSPTASAAPTLRPSSPQQTTTGPTTAAPAHPSPSPSSPRSTRTPKPSLSRMPINSTPASTCSTRSWAVSRLRCRGQLHPRSRYTHPMRRFRAIVAMLTLLLMMPLAHAHALISSAAVTQHDCCKHKPDACCGGLSESLLRNPCTGCSFPPSISGCFADAPAATDLRGPVHGQHRKSERAPRRNPSAGGVFATRPHHRGHHPSAYLK